MRHEKLFLNLGLFFKIYLRKSLIQRYRYIFVDLIFVDKIQIHRSHVLLLTLLFSGMCDNETVDEDLLRSRSACRSITTPYLPLLTPLRDLLEIKARRQRQNWRDCVTPAGPGGLVSGRCTGT